MPTSFWGQNPSPTPASPWNAPNFKLRFQNPTGIGSEAPFDYSVGQWTPRYQNFINNLPVEYIKAKLGKLRNFAGMADPQIRNLAFGYANQLGYVGSPSVTAAMKGPSTPPPAGAILPQGYSAPPQYNAPVAVKAPAPMATKPIAAPVQPQQLRSPFRPEREYNPFPTYNARRQIR